MRTALNVDAPSGQSPGSRAACQGLDAEAMLATLSRLEKHSRNGGFECAIDAVPAAQWDETAALFADPNYDQIARYSAEQWGRRTSHLLLRRHGESVAGAYAAIIKPPGCSHGVAFVRFGPFWRRRDAAPDLGIYRAAVGALVQEYCIRRGHYLTVVPRPNPEFYHQECEVLSRFGFALRRRVHDPNRYLVDLSHDEHAQRNSLDQKWRYNLRQALNNGFDIRLGQSEEDIRAFQSLHAGMVARKRFHNADMVHLLPRLAAELPQPLRPQIVLAFHRGRPVAGAAIAILGDTAYYVFGGSDGASLSLKGGYALQWWIVRWLSGHGVRWYDLGGEAGEHGLRQFKKGLVGKAGTVIRMHGEYDYWTGTSARLVGDIVYGMRGVQRMIRKLRYRA